MRTPKLHCDEACDENAEDHEEGDDPAVSPWVFRTTPLQRKEKGDDGWHQEHVPVEIEGLEAFYPSDARYGLAFGVVEQEHDGHNSDCSKWEINVEA